METVSHTTRLNVIEFAGMAAESGLVPNSQGNFSACDLASNLIAITPHDLLHRTLTAEVVGQRADRAAGAVIGVEPAGCHDPAVGCRPVIEPKTQRELNREGFGAPASKWTMRWDWVGAEKTIPAAYKMVFIEIALLNTAIIDAPYTRALMEKHGLRAVASLGLPKENWASVYHDCAVKHLTRSMDKVAGMGTDALSGVTYGGIGECTGVSPTKAEYDNIAAPWQLWQSTRKSWASLSGSNPLIGTKTTSSTPAGRRSG